ncbi:hypothetical protein [Halorubrum sp. DTA46]|uniref:hypothetical protein n=1 Tax=Halorubrum sp. DTA46 TaxID=3402162 RepID=UPI003AADE26F
MAQANQNTGSKTRVTAQIADRRKMELNQIAYQLSEPGDPVNVSQLIREAIELYVQQFDTDPDACSPRERGGFGGVEIELDEGAA